MSLGSGHLGIWLGRQASKENIMASRKHLKKIFDIISLIQEMVISFINDDNEEAVRKAKAIVDMEREADEIKEEIIDKLMNSSLHPMDQEEIVKLIMTADDIAAHCKSTARKLLYIHSQEVPPHIKEGLKGIIDLLVDEAYALRQTIEALLQGSNDITDNAEKTERLEEAIDDARVDLLAQILKWGDLSEHVSDWIMLKEAVENIETASDKIEDTADVLRQIAIMRGKPL
jgi:predicted phosphate transport protein (TIGR00153 family)